MRLYSLTDASCVQHEGETYEVDPDTTAVELPHDLAARLNALHVGGVKQWENDSERTNRLVAEELKRRQDPATLLAAVERLTADQPEPDSDATATLAAKVEELLTALTSEKAAREAAERAAGEAEAARAIAEAALATEQTKPAEPEPTPEHVAAPAKKAPAKKAAAKPATN